MSNTKDKIIHMFFEEHLPATTIANDLNVSKPYITKVINKDSRYKEEKDKRKLDTKIKKNERNKIMAKNKRIASYENSCLKSMHNKDVSFLSSTKEISDLDFAMWNLSIYERNKNGNLVAVNGIKYTYDVPKKINMKTFLKPQKCFNIV